MASYPKHGAILNVVNGCIDDAIDREKAVLDGEVFGVDENQERKKLKQKVAIANSRIWGMMMLSFPTQSPEISMYVVCYFYVALLAWYILILIIFKV